MVLSLQTSCGGTEDSTFAFLSEFCDDVIDDVRMRRRVPPCLFAHAQACDAVERPLLPQGATRAMRAQHVLHDLYEEAGKRGKRCCIAGCERRPVRPHLWCPGCSGWFHIECYFECHSVWKDE